jgi:hypothetical protein
LKYSLQGNFCISTGVTEFATLPDAKGHAAREQVSKEHPDKLLFPFLSSFTNSKILLK